MPAPASQSCQTSKTNEVRANGHDIHRSDLSYDPPLHLTAFATLSKWGKITASRRGYMYGLLHVLNRTDIACLFVFILQEELPIAGMPKEAFTISTLVRSRTIQ